MATKRKTKTKRQQLPAKTEQVVNTDIKLKQLFDSISIIASQLKLLQDQVGPLAGLHTLPTRSDVAELREAFTDLRVYMEEAREKIGGLSELRESGKSEFASRSEFVAWKHAIESRLMALERKMDRMHQVTGVAVTE